MMPTKIRMIIMIIKILYSNRLALLLQSHKLTFSFQSHSLLHNVSNRFRIQWSVNDDSQWSRYRVIYLCKSL